MDFVPHPPIDQHLMGPMIPNTIWVFLASNQLYDMATKKETNNVSKVSFIKSWPYCADSLCQNPPWRPMDSLRRRPVGYSRHHAMDRTFEHCSKFDYSGGSIFRTYWDLARPGMFWVFTAIPIKTKLSFFSNFEWSRNKAVPLPKAPLDSHQDM